MAANSHGITSACDGLDSAWRLLNSQAKDWMESLAAEALDCFWFSQQYKMSRRVKIMQHVAGLGIILSFCYPIHSQTKLKAPCEIDKPPVLRGFYIGQSVDEINALIPNFQAAFDKKRDLENRPEFFSTRTEAGFILVADTDVFYPRPGLREVPNDDYKDVEFFWHFLDGKLFFISAQYTQFEPPNLKTFVQQVAEKTNLPHLGWVFKDKDHAILRCARFDVEVWTGRYAARPDFGDYPSVMITDRITKAELEKREKAIKLRKKYVELERLRREKERRSIFKP
jgi:hypothetical protein